MIDRIEVAKKSRRAKEAAKKNIFATALVYLKFLFGTKKCYCCYNCRKGIAEECFFYSGNIAGEFYEEGHQREAEGSQQNACYSFCVVTAKFHLIKLFLSKRQNAVIVALRNLDVNNNNQ